MTEGKITIICIFSRVGRYVDNVENLSVSLIEIVNSADLGSSSKYKDEIVFGLRWRKVPEEEQFVQG
jgi:hypothetical protein